MIRVEDFVQYILATMPASPSRARFTARLMNTVGLIRFNGKNPVEDNQVSWVFCYDDPAIAKFKGWLQEHLIDRLDQVRCQQLLACLSHEADSSSTRNLIGMINTDLTYQYTGLLATHVRQFGKVNGVIISEHFKFEW